MVSNIVKIFIEEFKTIFKDPGSRLIMVSAILLYSLFYTMPFSHHSTRDVPIGVIDNDCSKLSHEFIRNIDSTEYVKVVKRLNDIEDGKNNYYRNKIRAFILIPKDFERDLKRGNPTMVTSYCDSAFLILYKQVATAVATLAGEMGAKIEIGTLMKKGVPKEAAYSMVNPILFIQNPLYNPIGSYQNYIYPLVLIMILHQTMLIGVSMLGATSRENKKKNTYSDNPVEIVLGKSLAYVSLYFIYSLFYFFIFPLVLVYDMTYNILPMLLILVPFLFATAFLGISLVYFCKTRELPFFIMIVSSVPLIFLPGFVWPNEAIPPFLNILSKFIPFEAAADGLVRINQMGACFGQVLHDFVILTCLCLIYFFTAVYTVKKIESDG